MMTVITIVIAPAVVLIRVRHSSNALRLNSFNPHNNLMTMSYHYPHFTDEEILDI